MTKTDVIKAAFRVWGRELYRKTSLSQVARELGVTKPALYRHFKNKQELLNEMYNYFFDEYAAAVKADHDRALQTEDRDECFLIICRSLVRFYGLNRDIFIFSLIRVYGNRRMKDTWEHFAGRGVDMRRFFEFKNDARGYPSLMQFVMATVIFWLGYFHKTYADFPEAVSPDEAGALVERELAFLERKLGAGLGLDSETVAALDFRGLEGCLDGGLPEYSEDDRLLRAVAAAVAEAGPWSASMDMVARRSGLSKSGLYSHFENKGEMLAQLFLTELERIIAYAGASREKSSRAEERLYLVVIAGANYLRSRPEFLIAMDWLRMRNLNLGDHTPPRFCRLFEGIGLKGLRGDSPDLPDLSDSSGSEPQTERFAQWIFFLIINVLMRWKAGEGAAAPSVENIAGVPNECFRLLYKFIALGMKGFDV
ncbi:MAG: TetR/AcrR family transcriptional regulator [Treponema sp.]|jgi:AcrR family transcriptional regulator|nr:TetR/AcrR family transcriptional regulator [Treponema sp.]